MDSEIAGLEHKLATLLADYNRLRAENSSLRREVLRVQEQSRALADKVATASSRLDLLLRRLPESTG